MELLLHLPAFLKVILAFAAILIVYRLGVPLGWSIVASSLVLSLWTGLGLAALKIQAVGIVRVDNILVLVAILFLLYFTESLNQTGRMDRTVKALRDWLANRRALIAGLPALVGLLPMPGGALVSAPLVGSMDSEESLTPPLKVAINYWYRHIWEYWWPLYPGVILAIKYSTLPIGIYYLIMAPFTVVAVVAGYWFILRRMPFEDKKETGKRVLNRSDVAAALWPIGLLVCISILGSSFLPGTGVPARIANLVAMVAGLLVALAVLFAKKPDAFVPSLAMFKSKKVWSVMLVVLGVTMFSSALKMPLREQGTTYVLQMRDEFFALGVPLVLVLMLLPFLSGFVTGIAVGFVGASFPLCFALLGSDPSLGELMATTVFCYTFGYMGMILSPIHICFVVTNEYFKSRLHKAYPYLIGPVICVSLTAVVLAGALYVLR